MRSGVQLPVLSKRRIVRDFNYAVALGIKSAPGCLAAYFGVAFVAGCMPLVSALLMKSVLDGLVRHRGDRLAWAVSGIAAAAVLSAVSPLVCGFLRKRLQRALLLRAQDRLFAAVNGFHGLARFEDPDFLDRLRLAQQNGGSAPLDVITGSTSLVQAGLTISGFFGTLAAMNLVAALAVLLSAAPIFAAEMVLSRRMAALALRLGPLERRELFFSRLLTDVSAVKEIRLFGGGDFFRKRMLDERRRANALRNGLDRRELVVQVALDSLAGLILGCVLLWAGRACLSGHASLGDFSLFVAAIAGSQAAVSGLVSQLAQSYQSLLLFDHFVEVINSGPDLVSGAEDRCLESVGAGIEFRDVWFRYSPEHSWVLRGVSLRVPPGISVGLVGANGAGKSTLVKLLCRFYDPDRGEIFWDGRNIKDIPIEELRKRISAVFQDYMKYDLTARENIAISCLHGGPLLADVKRAASVAGIDEFLSRLPDGYDTLLSRVFFLESEKTNRKTGIVLSGGQWQRVAVARALFRGARDLVILDEPSAGLDPEAEHEIHQHLMRMTGGGIRFLVSHRLGVIRSADMIAVLDRGKVVEWGDHEHLLGRNGVYARLFAMQAAGYVSGESIDRHA